jgi:hypothetical protein
MTPIHTYRVTIPGFDAALVPAHSTGQALDIARERFIDSFSSELANHVFAHDARVAEADLAPDEGYDYVCRAYDMALEAGQRVRLAREGSSQDREGWVVYPGRGTSYAHVWFDGDERSTRVHPTEIEILPSLEVKP